MLGHFASPKVKYHQKSYRGRTHIFQPVYRPIMCIYGNWGRVCMRHGGLPRPDCRSVITARALLPLGRSLFVGHMPAALGNCNRCRVSTRAANKHLPVLSALLPSQIPASNDQTVPVQSGAARPSRQGWTSRPINRLVWTSQTLTGQPGLVEPSTGQPLISRPIDRLA